MRSNFHSKLEKLLLIVLAIFLFYQFIFYSNHYPVHDEVKSITLLTSYKTFLLKFYGHNHYLTTIIGDLIIFFFGVKLELIRSISFFSFLTILFFFYKKYQSTTSVCLIYLIYINTELALQFSILYRGYYFAALLFVIIFFLIENYKKNNYIIIYILLSLLMFHNITSLFLVLPIIIYLIIEIFAVREKKKEKLILLVIYFGFTSILLQSVSVIIQGIFDTKIYENGMKNTQVIKSLANNFLLVFNTGVDGIFFNKYTGAKLFSNLENFISNIYTHPLFFSVFIISFFKSIYNFSMKRWDKYDLIILLFLITFFIINRYPPPRVYISFFFFFLFYIFNTPPNFYKTTILGNKNIFYINIILCGILFYQISHVNFLEKLYTYKEEIKKIETLLDCHNSDFTKTKNLNEFDKHLYYYTYMTKCDKKPNLDKFYIFYKSDR